MQRRSISNHNKGPGGSGSADTPPPADNQDMNNIGLNMAVGAQDLKKIHEKRMRKGECPSCGVKCYKVTGNLLGRKKFMPLTIAGHVKDGICLTCHPAAQHAPTDKLAPPPHPVVHRQQHRTDDVHAPENFQIPQFINDDNDTVMSSITMDHRLWSFPGEDQFHAPDSRWHGIPPASSPRKDQPFTATTTLRPEASFAISDNMDDRPTLPLRKASGRSHQQQHAAAAALMKKEAEEKAALRAGSFRGQVEGIRGLEDTTPFDESKIALVENEEEEEEGGGVEEEKLEEEEEMRRSLKYQYPPPPPIAHGDADADAREIHFDSSHRRLMDYPKAFSTDGGSIIEANSPRGAGKGRISDPREMIFPPELGMNNPREMIFPEELGGGKMEAVPPRHREINVNRELGVPPLSAPILPPRPN